ncbi:MAG: hypothetical protein H7Y07_13805 [Pyrinomonadaceae bacterium]|nr:hypothetical protein [Sphingobacteriaceae bacterium]
MKNTTLHTENIASLLLNALKESSIESNFENSEDRAVPEDLIVNIKGQGFIKLSIRNNQDGNSKLSMTLEGVLTL